MSEHKPSRWLYLLTAGVLLLGTLLVAAGTRNSGDADAHARQTGGMREVCLPASTTPELQKRGAILQQMECAGCHSDDRREIGPSYAVIAERYQCRPAELSGAIGHPEPGWADYPRGPAGPNLAPDDRAALGAWILLKEGKGDE